jgi:serine phosphatase RsbU (regulator of sigma subunit)
LILGLQKDLRKEDSVFEEGEGYLEDGDKVFLYTDGIVELKNQQGEQCGTHWFPDLLKSLHKESVNRITQEIRQTLKDFSNYFVDDVSLIGFEKKSERNDSNIEINDI